MTPTFATQPVPEIDAQVRTLLPIQGSCELQRDMPGRVHDWHRHSLDEELFVLEGDVLLFWDEEGTLHERLCIPGTWITLPAGTVHGSIAGSSGAVYVIRPENGQTAQTVFLPREECPHPTPDPAAAGRRVEASA